MTTVLTPFGAVDSTYEHLERFFKDSYIKQNKHGFSVVADSELGKRKDGTSCLTVHNHLKFQALMDYVNHCLFGVSGIKTEQKISCCLGLLRMVGKDGFVIDCTGLKNMPYILLQNHLAKIGVNGYKQVALNIKEKTRSIAKNFEDGF